MSELLPCPFCGGEAFVRIDVSLRPTQSRYRVGCDKDSTCHGWYGHSRYYATEAEAIAAWNSRADYHGYEQAAIESWKEIKDYTERTCQLIEDSGLLHCSECGGVAEERLWAYWHYCPNCGAKVVSE